MDYIYSRVSTDEQNVEGQLTDLKERFPSATIIEETGSGIKYRPKLDALLKSLSSGDRLIVAALDRLGRRTIPLLSLLEDLQKRKIIFISLREGIDYSTITGEFMATIFAGFARMEQRLISDRTKAALKAARLRGIKLGRPTYLPPEMLKKALALVESGVPVRVAALTTMLSSSYVYKLLKDSGITEADVIEHERMRHSPTFSTE